MLSEHQATDANTAIEASDWEKPKGESGYGKLSNTRFPDSTCTTEQLQQAASESERNPAELVELLKANHLAPKSNRLRADLVLVRFGSEDNPMLFRVAILKNREAAELHLYKALREHGYGTWGLVRGNLAVLSPEPADPKQVMDFLADSKLACWGALRITGRDDIYAIGGGYTEI